MISFTWVTLLNDKIVPPSDDKLMQGGIKAHLLEMLACFTANSKALLIAGA